LIDSRPVSNGSEATEVSINPTGVNACYFRIKLTATPTIINEAIMINAREIRERPEKTMEHGGTLYRWKNVKTRK
jgi:hypothetical protein